jgi:hypothetical protein
MTVQNLAQQVKPFVDRMDWMEVPHIASHPKKKTGKSTIKNK